MTRSTGTDGTTDEPFDYWAWYLEPGNTIREWDAEHGVRLVRQGTLNGIYFQADRDILFADSPTTNIYPEYFANRTLDRFSLSIYSYGTNREKARAAYEVVAKYIENYSRVVSEYGGGGLYFCSKERGTGKTFLSTILGNELTRRGHRVRWYSMTNLLQEIKAGYDRESSTSSAEIINSCRNAEVLILDDIGVEKQSAWLNETMYTILDYRMSQCRPTMFTSNHRPHELGYDERIIDRITRMTELIEMPEESIRKKLNAKNPFGSFIREN